MVDAKQTHLILKVSSNIQARFHTSAEAVAGIPQALLVLIL